MIVSGTKGFAMWREPDEGAAAKVEAVGIPSRKQRCACEDNKATC